MTDDKMFCFQCEQTAGCAACTGAAGVCGKPRDVALLQDELTGALIALAATAANSPTTRSMDDLAILSMFACITNVDFSGESIEGLAQRVRALTASRAAGTGSADEYDMRLLWDGDEDIRSLKSLVLFGARGIAAYAYHAAQLGYRDPEVSAFIYKALRAIGSSMGTDELLPLVMEAGAVNLKAMELLDRANTETYGSPTPTTVPMEIEPGPFVVISGHDLHDLQLLLEQTEGRGVNVYTHGEMLPAHAYPELRKYRHLKGNFGTAWQNQREEFDGVPGAFLFTTNCLMPPKASYADRVFATGAVNHPAVERVPDGDFSAVIERAIELGGYSEPHPMTGINGGSSVTTGFGRDAVLSVAPAVIDAVKSGALKRFILVGGCDGARAGRNYFTELVEQAPQDTVILTLACGKYRFNDLDLGEIGGIPRLLDIGQCNDAYSAIKIALALADAFDCGVNDLPLSFVLSWYEQKAVSVLLTLLYLGIEGIYLGPTLPAFVSPTVLQFLVDNFNIRPTGAVEDDLAQIMGE